MRAEEDLNIFDKVALGLLSAMLVREFRSDARIGIKALEILGRVNKWTDEVVISALRQAYVEVEGETLRNLRDMDLLILACITKNLDTNKSLCRSNECQQLPGLGDEQVNILQERQLSAEPKSGHTEQEKDWSVLHHGIANFIIFCIYCIWRA